MEQHTGQHTVSRVPQAMNNTLVSTQHERPGQHTVSRVPRAMNNTLVSTLSAEFPGPWTTRETWSAYCQQSSPGHGQHERPGQHTVSRVPRAMDNTRDLVSILSAEFPGPTPTAVS
eukprot:TRINITY_DN28959_c1_g1_i4.p1 TRINITY_DN28959_c1_g1~~TRINITY_DN28959_c1_g1_i4.p1  ORF type:complete len:116 (+),score=25.69 TRINITY_DN28959_c1_g1_i4:99-446(+)